MARGFAVVASTNLTLLSLSERFVGRLGDNSADNFVGFRVGIG